MKRGRRVLMIPLTCGVVALAVALLWPREHEPEYKGKKLSEWLLEERRLGKSVVGINVPAEAIRQIGTNALPFLLRWIRYEVPPWRDKVSDTLEKLNSSSLGLPDERQLRADDAALGFQILGPQAIQAVPELMQLMKSTNRDAALRGFHALDTMGIHAFPGLLDALTNRQAYVRVPARALVRAARHLGTNASVMVPVLLEQLRDNDPEVAAMAALLLGGLAVEPELVVPALMNSLQAPQARVRYCAVDALGGFGDQARAAMPSLLRALGDSNKRVRNAATNAIELIAPEVLRKEPIHSSF